MSYFLLSKEATAGKEVILRGEEARHLGYARRAYPGEEVKVQDTQGRRFAAQVLKVARNEVRLQILQEIEVPPESPLKIALFQALIAEQALDYILQKSTELGVTEIYLFPSEHSPYHFVGERLVKKFTRWQRICEEAAKQCERAKIPEVQFVADPERLKEKLTQYAARVILHPGAEQSLTAFLRAQNTLSSVGVVVGPEGGFSAQEVEILKNAPNVQVVHLGGRILRTETAVSCALALAQAIHGDLQ
ncbi:16S rRNA (uracil(1498)-N(3))-methyltransferase [Candidatus Uhrbacteria bacterium]|nr:16S rRNA (uracil(1498)-N(3))-methyltransferase [Candidatus Uhrbacteria bacterium]